MLITSSCGPLVCFEQPQPANNEMEYIFPKAMQGIYNDDLNSLPLIIDELTCEYGNGNFIPGIIEGQLSDSLVLQKHKPYYILNLKDGKGWHVIVISLQNIDLAVHSING